MSQIKITDAESEIMKVLWKSQEALSASEISELLPREVEWKPTTILTLLSRLFKKEALSQEKKGRSYYYTPLVSEREYAALETKNLLKRIHGDSALKMVATLYESNAISPEEMEQLRNYLGNKK